MGGKPRPKRNKVEVVEGFYGIALYVDAVIRNKPNCSNSGSIRLLSRNTDIINSALEEEKE